MMTSELWDADGQSECAGSSVGAAGDLRQVFWREQREPVLVDSCTYLGWVFVLSNCELILKISHITIPKLPITRNPTVNN